MGRFRDRPHLCVGLGCSQRNITHGFEHYQSCTWQWGSWRWCSDHECATVTDAKPGRDTNPNADANTDANTYTYSSAQSGPSPGQRHVRQCTAVGKARSGDNPDCPDIAEHRM